MTNKRKASKNQSEDQPLEPTGHEAESLLASDDSDRYAGYDSQHESLVLAEIEAERAGSGGAPTGLLALMLAPLLLVAFPLLLLWFLRPAPATNPTPTSNPVVSGQAPAVQSASPIAWQTSLNDGLALARQSGKPLMVDFYADWCPPCKMLDKETWPDPAVAQEAQNVVAVKVNVDNDSESASRYRIGALPSIVWMDSNGNEKGRISGFVSPQEMLGLMQRYR